MYSYSIHTQQAGAMVPNVFIISIFSQKNVKSKKVNIKLSRNKATTTTTKHIFYQFFLMVLWVCISTSIRIPYNDKRFDVQVKHIKNKTNTCTHISITWKWNFSWDILHTMNDWILLVPTAGCGTHTQYTRTRNNKQPHIFGTVSFFFSFFFVGRLLFPLCIDTHPKECTSSGEQQQWRREAKKGFLKCWARKIRFVYAL